MDLSLYLRTIVMLLWLNATTAQLKIRYCTQVKKKLRGDVLTGIETHSYVGVSDAFQSYY